MTIVSFLGCKKNDVSLNQTPFVQFINPLSSNSSSSISLDESLNITALATDKDGEIENVQFFINGQLIANDYEAPWTQEVHFDEEAYYSLALIAIDNKNKASDTAYYKLNVIDYNKPHIEISISPNFYIKEKTPVTFIVNSFSDNGKIINTKVFLDDILIAEDTVSYYMVVKDSIAVGNHQVYAEVEDETGKISKSFNRGFNVNKNNPPEIELSSYNSSNLIPGSTIYADIHATDWDGGIDSVHCYLNDTLVKTFYSDNYHSLHLVIPKSGEYKLSAKAWDDNGASVESDDVFYNVQEGFLPKGPITNIIPSTNDNEFFALSKSNNHLMLLYPFSAPNRNIDLPYSIPIDMDYSPTEEKLFIVYQNHGVVSIWDQNTEEFSTIIFSDIADAISVVSDVIHRRIYVETDKGFFIINMDNGQVLHIDTIIEFDRFIVDSENQLLFTANYTHELTIKKYSLANDSIVLQQTREDLGYVCMGMALNKHKDYFLAISSNSNDGNGNHYAFKTSNINELYGEFDNVNYPGPIVFTTDDETLVAIDDIENTFIMINASSFEIEKTIDIRYASNAIVAVNNSKTKAVIYSHSTYDTDYKLLYYRLD